MKQKIHCAVCKREMKRDRHYFIENVVGDCCEACYLKSLPKIDEEFVSEGRIESRAPVNFKIILSQGKYIVELSEHIRLIETFLSEEEALAALNEWAKARF